MYILRAANNTWKNNGEIKRRIKIGWKTFGLNRDILKSNMLMCLQRIVYNQCVIPAMTYGCETWKLTKKTENLHRIAQRAKERSMLGIIMWDRHRSTWISAKTRVKDIEQVVKKTWMDMGRAYSSNEWQ